MIARVSAEMGYPVARAGADTVAHAGRAGGRLAKRPPQGLSTLVTGGDYRYVRLLGHCRCPIGSCAGRNSGSTGMSTSGNTNTNSKTTKSHREMDGFDFRSIFSKSASINPEQHAEAWEWKQERKKSAPRQQPRAAQNYSSSINKKH